jgi:hypothetical protein
MEVQDATPTMEVQGVMPETEVSTILTGDGDDAA